MKTVEGGKKPSSIFLSSFRYFKRKLEEQLVIGGKELKFLEATGDDYIRADLKNLESNKKKGYIAAIVMGDIERNRGSYNNLLLSQGIPLSKNTIANKITRIHLRPVIIRANIKFLSQDYEDILSFIEQWMLMQPQMLYLRINDAVVNIKASPNETMSPPPVTRDNSDPFGDWFVVETDVSLETYVGYTTEHGLVHKVAFGIKILGQEIDEQLVEVELATKTVELDGK